MEERYLKYYRRHSLVGWLVFLGRALSARSNLVRQGWLNRARDYLELQGDAGRLRLHLDLNEILLRAQREWREYDYGEGYFYQGLATVSVRGLRDTEARLRAMGLAERIRGRRVLNVGCNSGFLDLAVAHCAAHIDAFELNPFLVEIARRTAEHLGITNVAFTASSFEEWQGAGGYEALLSFANHSTYDRQTRQSVEQYLQRCHDLLAPGGQLLFESHAPGYEGERVEHVIRLIGERFRIDEQHTLEYGTHLDTGRRFVVATRS